MCQGSDKTDMLALIYSTIQKLQGSIFPLEERIGEFFNIRAFYILKLMKFGQTSLLEQDLDKCKICECFVIIYFLLPF